MIGPEPLSDSIVWLFCNCPTERELLSRHVETHRHQCLHDAVLASHGRARRVGQAHWTAVAQR